MITSRQSRDLLGKIYVMSQNVLRTEAWRKHDEQKAGGWREDRHRCEREERKREWWPARDPMSLDLI